jgi:hypothetical protein
VGIGHGYLKAQAGPALREIARKYQMRAVDEGPFVSLPLADEAAWQDEAETAARVQRLSYERPVADWSAIRCNGRPSEPPVRFIDGSIFSRTVAAFSVGPNLRPAVLACVGSLALTLDGRRLTRAEGSLRVDTVLCLLINGIPGADVKTLEAGLTALGIRLVTSETAELPADFDVLRRRSWNLAKQSMEEAERAVLLAEPQVPAVIDGLLERKLTTIASQDMAAYGVVKRQMRHYLPDSLLRHLYDLKAGERTPSFMLETEHASIISWYLRLSEPGLGAPGAGIVRVTAPRQGLERRFPEPETRWGEISAVSAYLCGLRHRERGYERVGVSLEPIVRVEDELHAVLPDVMAQVAKLHRALGV